MGKFVIELAFGNPEVPDRISRATIEGNDPADVAERAHKAIDHFTRERTEPKYEIHVTGRPDPIDLYDSLRPGARPRRNPPRT